MLGNIAIVNTPNSRNTSNRVQGTITMSEAAGTMSEAAGNEPWQPCTPGTLSGFAARANRLRWQQRTIVAGSALATGVSILLIAIFSVSDPQTPVRPGIDNSHGHLACRDVLQAVDRYLTNQVEKEYGVQIVQHLNHCPRCQRRYQQRADQLGVELTGLVVSILKSPRLLSGIALLI